MRIRSQSDFWCGVIFVVIGVAFILLARRYNFGTAARMGPGYFPTLVGALLAGLGLLLAVPALLRDGEAFPKLHLRPLLLVLAGIVAFSLLLAPLGFVLAAMVLMVVAGFADPDLRFFESAGVAVFLTAVSVVVFVILLGLPFELWPSPLR